MQLRSGSGGKLGAVTEGGRGRIACVVQPDPGPDSGSQEDPVRFEVCPAVLDLVGKNRRYLGHYNAVR